MENSAAPRPVGNDPQGAKVPIGLRSVAGIEFAKGILFLLFALGAFSFEQRAIANAANTLIRQLHIDPTWRYAIKLVDATAALTPSKLKMLV